MDKNPPVIVRQHQGQRIEMEDRFSIVDKVQNGTFVGVYDGHGGADVADILVHKISGKFLEEVSRTDDMQAAMLAAYEAADHDTSDYECGATAANAFINCRKMVYAHVGDCTVWVSGLHTKRLTPHHRVDNPSERARVSSAGAILSAPYFLHKGKGLMPTRAFGDNTMREVGLQSIPDVGIHIFSPGDRFVILTTDGISDVLDAADLDRIIDGRTDTANIADDIIREASAGGATDNMTVIIVPVASGNRS